MIKIIKILFSLILLNCAGSGIKLMPEYSTMNVAEAKLGIIIVKENIFVNNINDVVDDLGAGDPRKVFGGFFANEFRKFSITYSKFSEITAIDNYSLDSLIEKKELLSPGDTVPVRVPAMNFCSNDSLQFIMIIDNISVVRRVVNGPTPTDDLVLTGTFTLWDNVNQKIVSFGKISEYESVSFAMNKNTWSAVTNAVSKAVFIGKPYGKPAVN